MLQEIYNILIRVQLEDSQLMNDLSMVKGISKLKYIV